MFCSFVTALSKKKSIKLFSFTGAFSPLGLKILNCLKKSLCSCSPTIYFIDGFSLSICFFLFWQKTRRKLYLEFSCMLHPIFLFPTFLFNSDVQKHTQNYVTVTGKHATQNQKLRIQTVWNDLTSTYMGRLLYTIVWHQNLEIARTVCSSSLIIWTGKKIATEEIDVSLNFTKNRNISIA